MGTILGNFLRAIAGLFNKLKAETKKLIPVAIAVVQGLKEAMDSPVDDILALIIKKAIPGDADDLLIDKITETVKAWLPKILLEMKMIESIVNIEDQNAQLQAILAEIKLNSDESKNILFHGIASLILEKLADGKLSWGDSIAISEYYYQNFVKK